MRSILIFSLRSTREALRETIELAKSKQPASSAEEPQTVVTFHRFQVLPRRLYRTTVATIIHMNCAFTILPFSCDAALACPHFPALGRGLGRGRQSRHTRRFLLGGQLPARGQGAASSTRSCIYPYHTSTSFLALSLSLSLKALVTGAPRGLTATRYAGRRDSREGRYFSCSCIRGVLR